MKVSPEIEIQVVRTINKILEKHILFLSQQLADLAAQCELTLADRDVIRGERDRAISERDAVRISLDALVMEQKEEEPADAAE